MGKRILSPKNKRILYRIIPFGVIWLISGWIFLIVELAASDNYGNLPEAAIKVDSQIFVLSSFALVTVGFLIGFLELNYFDKVFTNKTFGIRFFWKLFIYSGVFFFIILVLYPIASSIEMDTHVFDERVWNKYRHYFRSLSHLSTIIQLAASLALSLFYSEINDFIGHGVLRKFFTGKYHTPVEEERIFMFLDMKSSTTIAEKLGHLAYFKLLKAYYNCFTDAIIKYDAEIYQYVGDEIILSWKVRKGKLDNRSIECFFELRKNLKARADWFKRKWGFAPIFKAGIHTGKVTIGEIGSIKKDMMFSGDVLNSTARIQALCNAHNVDLIISSDLIQLIDTNSTLKINSLGAIALKGRAEQKELFAVEKRIRYISNPSPLL
jgi:adenylate cyclase